MPSTNSDISAMAIENMNCCDDIARASRQVIARRVALGIDAALLPHHADHVEFARIIPEKVEAFSAAGHAMMQKSGEAQCRIAAQVSLEVTTAATAAMSMSQCSTPAELAIAQAHFASAWMARAAARVIGMSLFALAAQAAALAPIRQTVVENSHRLAH